MNDTAIDRGALLVVPLRACRNLAFVAEEADETRQAIRRRRSEGPSSNGRSRGGNGPEASDTLRA